MPALLLVRQQGTPESTAIGPHRGAGGHPRRRRIRDGGVRAERLQLSHTRRTGTEAQRDAFGRTAGAGSGQDEVGKVGGDLGDPRKRHSIHSSPPSNGDRSPGRNRGLWTRGGRRAGSGPDMPPLAARRYSATPTPTARCMSLPRDIHSDRATHIPTARHPLRPRDPHPNRATSTPTARPTSQPRETHSHRATHAPTARHHFPRATHIPTARRPLPQCGRCPTGTSTFAARRVSLPRDARPHGASPRRGAPAHRTHERRCRTLPATFAHRPSPIARRAPRAPRPARSKQPAPRAGAGAEVSGGRTVRWAPRRSVGW